MKIGQNNRTICEAIPIFALLQELKHRFRTADGQSSNLGCRCYPSLLYLLRLKFDGRKIIKERIGISDSDVVSSNGR